MHMPCTRHAYAHVHGVHVHGVHVQVRLFRDALRLPKYAGLGLSPDTKVDMALHHGKRAVLVVPQLASQAFCG